MTVDATRRDDAGTHPPMGRDEAEELTKIFAAELARGWIPTAYDIEDALNTLRRH